MASIYADVSDDGGRPIGTSVSDRGDPSGPRYYQQPRPRFNASFYDGYDGSYGAGGYGRPQYGPTRKRSHLAKWVVGGAVAAGLIVAAIFAIRRYKGTTFVILPVVNGNPPKKMTMLQMGPPTGIPSSESALPVDLVAFSPVPKVYHLNGSLNDPMRPGGPVFANPAMNNPSSSRGRMYPQQSGMENGPLGPAGATAASAYPPAGPDFLQVNGGGMPEPMVDTSFVDNVVSRTHG